MEHLSFLDYFEDLEDPRVDRHKLYSLEEILLTTLCALLSGADGWSDIAAFGGAKLSILSQYLSYDNGIPTDDTFRRFFASIDHNIFKSCFHRWIKDIIPEHEIGTIAIDGKTSRRTYDGLDKPLHMVHAFASAARLVLGQQACAKKSNEITAIPELLSALDIKGQIISIDAMGCQQKIARQIRIQGGEYVLGLKKNQKHLYGAVETCFGTEEIYDTAAKVTETETAHGRIDTRTARILDVSEFDWIKRRFKSWHDLSSIIMIERTRIEKGNTSHEKSYYISSMVPDPAKALYAVRSHWAVENSLHWVMDVCFNDDESRIRKENAPQNIAIMKHFSLNILQETQSKLPKKHSIKSLRKKIGWDDHMLTFAISHI